MSDRKLAHLNKLRQAYIDAIRVVEDNEGKKLKKYKEKIVEDGCFHPECYVIKYKEDNDDGYGKWWKTEYTKCRLCGKFLNTAR